MFLDKQNIQWNIYTEPAEYEHFMTFGSCSLTSVKVREAQSYISISFINYPYIIEESHYLYDIENGPNYYILTWLNNFELSTYTNWFN